VREGHIVSLGRGAFALADHYPEKPEGQHELRLRGALLNYPKAHPCGVSTLIRAGVALWGVPLGKVELARPERRQVDTQMCRLRCADDPLRSAIDGPVAIAQALVQVAVDHGIQPGIIATDSALNQGLAVRSDVDAVVGSLGRRPFGAHARAMMALVDPQCESVGESRLRILCRMAGIELDSQVVIRARNGQIVARADFRVKGTRILLEFDGKVKYASGDGDTLWREKKREDALRALGFIVLRVTWADLENAAALLKRIRAAVATNAA